MNHLIDNFRPSPILLLSTDRRGATLFADGLCQNQHFARAGTLDFQVTTPDQWSKILDQTPQISPAVETQQSLYEVGGWQFRSAATSDTDIPAWIEFLRERQFPIVHLSWGNPLDGLISELSAEAQPKNYDPRSLIARIRERQEQSQQIRRWLLTCHSIELSYERLVDNDHARISDTALSQLRRFLGLEIGPFTVANLRVVGIEALQRAILKRALRPDFTRYGYGHLFEMPKAA